MYTSLDKDFPSYGGKSAVSWGSWRLLGHLVLAGGTVGNHFCLGGYKNCHIFHYHDFFFWKSPLLAFLLVFNCSSFIYISWKILTGTPRQARKLYALHHRPDRVSISMKELFFKLFSG